VGGRWEQARPARARRSSGKARSTPEVTGTHSSFKSEAPWALGTESSTAWASARRQLNAALHVSASAPSAQRQRAAARGASEHGRRSKDGARTVHARHTPPLPLRSRGRTLARMLPATRARSASLSYNAQAVDSALGFGTLVLGPRLQHELTAEVERAKHRALWVRARAVRPPGNDAIAWHAAENAEYPTQGLCRQGCVRVRMWDISNGTHSPAGDGHSPRQRPVPDLRRRQPGPS
jgi:hypothetical protein